MAVTTREDFGMKKLIDQLNVDLSDIYDKYMSRVNNVASLFIDYDIPEPSESDLGKKPEDPEGVINNGIGDWLMECSFDDRAVLRDMVQKETDDLGPDEAGVMAMETLGGKLADRIMELINDCKGEVFMLTEKGADKYYPDWYIIYYDMIGMIHLREPEECWALICANWSD